MFSRKVEIKGENGVPTDNLIYNMREDNSCKWLFVAHGRDALDSNWDGIDCRDDSDSPSLQIRNALLRRKCNLQNRIRQGTLFLGEFAGRCAVFLFIGTVEYGIIPETALQIRLCGRSA